jgi:16S rRNA (cytidine1402-2'-O)-methyltransferase
MPIEPRESGVLYVVATPIGNLDDISARARSVLAGVDAIAAEDTRHTGRLLASLGVSTPLIALHEHNESERAAAVLDRVAAGESIALVSDAGTPLISDPGYRLVALARERCLRVVAIPGSCAAIAALSVAGLPTDRFRFEGFLPARSAARRARLELIRNAAETLVFYEAVHRIGEMLADLAAVLGAGRRACVLREMTKLHESAYIGTLAEIASQRVQDAGGDRGEFTLVVAGAVVAAPADEELARVVAILAAELPPTQAAALAARITGGERRAAYRLALESRGPTPGALQDGD